MRALLAKFGSLDRRFIFLVMGFSIVIPVVKPCEIPFRTHEKVQSIYDTVEALKPGATVLVASDFDPGSAPELYPFLLAIYHHLFSREGVKVVTSSLWPAAPPLVDKALAETAPEHGKTYGVDYVNLGFLEGKHIVILSMGQNMRTTYEKDIHGTPIDDLRIMDGINTLKDFDLIISISSGTPGTKEWVQLVQSRYGLDMVASCTAVSAPDYIPYYQSGQLIGLAGGMKGSAEYEQLIERPGTATAGMDVLSIGHLFIVLAVFLGNVSYFVTRKRKR